MFDTYNFTADPEDANAEPRGPEGGGMLVDTSTRTVQYYTAQCWSANRIRQIPTGGVLHSQYSNKGVPNSRYHSHGQMSIPILRLLRQDTAQFSTGLS